MRNRVVSITAARDADNITNLSIVDYKLDPVDLDVLGATAVFVEVCGSLYDSTISAESFTGNSVSIKFGKLDVPSGKTYSPKIYYVSPDYPDGRVLVAAGFETEIKLRMVR